MKKLQKNFFSIIIPIYNSEKTIFKCITSIIKQNIDCEIIVIDDLSKDKTLNIVMELKKKFKNIKILKNKHNIGVSKTRNIGIKHATGEYLIFLDSDDFLFNESLLKLKEYINANTKPDVIFGKYEKKTFPGNNDLILNNLRMNKNNILKFKKLILIKKFPLDECWPYIINRKFLLKNKIQFFDVRVAEDQLFVLNVFLKMKTFYIFKKNFYYHRNLPGTLSDFMNFEYSKCCLKVLLEYYKILAKEKNLINKQLINRYIQSCFSMFIAIFITSSRLEIKELGKILKKNNAINLKNLHYKNSKINFNVLFQKYGYEKGLLQAKKSIIYFKRKKIERFIVNKRKIYFFCYSKFLNASAEIMGKNWKKVIGVLDQNKLLRNKSFKNKKIFEPDKILNKKKNIDTFIIINNQREITIRKIKNYLLSKKFSKNNFLVLDY